MGLSFSIHLLLSKGGYNLLYLRILFSVKAFREFSLNLCVALVRLEPYKCIKCKIHQPQI